MSAAATPSSTPAAVPGLGRVLRGPRGAAVRVAPRAIVVAAGLVVVVAALLVVAIGTGQFPISPGDVVASLFGGGDAATRFIVDTLRLPRALTALLVGGALGASGAIFQSLTRNPLGSPDIVGFIQGASAGAVLEILVLGGGALATTLGAVGGGLLTAVLVYLLAIRGHGAQNYRLVLVGIGLAAMLSAVTDYLLSRTTLEQASAAELWLTGSLNGAAFSDVDELCLAFVVLIPLIAWLAPRLRMLELGDEAAQALGVPVQRSRAGLVFLSVALCAAATAAAGPVTFVALAGPQISRRLTRATGPGIVSAALTGAALVLASDVLGQRIVPSAELPVGVVTGVLGGLYLVGLLAFEWRARATT